MNLAIQQCCHADIHSGRLVTVLLKVTTTLSDVVVYLNCQGSATNKSSPSSSPSRHTLIHEFGDLDMPLAVAQLGHAQEHPQELQWNLSSPVELK